MNLTQTSNKELAAAISVDRSLISLLRTGKRGMPRNREHISRMAYFFSKHCVADFQRHALSEMLEQSILRSSMPSSALAEYIFKWLSDDYDIVENTLSRISHTPAVPEPKHNISASNHISSSNDETEYFYINSESGNIEKTEFYKDDAIKSIAKYVYSYNTVTDDDILIFDINNYLDYTYNEI